MTNTILTVNPDRNPRMDSLLPNRFVHLDMLRGIAAFVVVAEHARAFIFVQYSELSGLHPAWQIFYAVTTFGHQAVMIFFALSGFLVGGKVFEDFRTGTWSWPKYALRRLTRLWIVVLPALILTLLLDQLGSTFGFAEGYEGISRNLYSSLPADGVGAEHSVFIFLGNAVFLQTIIVPVYGSNGPLWSLAYEFWYYVMAPFLASMLYLARHPATLIVNTLIFGVIFWLLPEPIIYGGLIWLGGAIARVLLPSLNHFIQPHSGILTLLGLIVVGAMLLVAEMRLLPAADLVLGFAVAAVLPILAVAPVRGQTYQKIASGMAEISYTLYATHFPLLMGATMIFLAPARFEPGLQAALVYLLFLSGILLSSVLLWAFFERHTDRIYGALSKRIPATHSAKPKQNR